MRRVLLAYGSDQRDWLGETWSFPWPTTFIAGEVVISERCEFMLSRVRRGFSRKTTPTIA